MRRNGRALWRAVENCRRVKWSWGHAVISRLAIVRAVWHEVTDGNGPARLSDNAHRVRIRALRVPRACLVLCPRPIAPCVRYTFP